MNRRAAATNFRSKGESMEPDDLRRTRAQAKIEGFTRNQAARGR